jgi:hypothetical protein
MRDNTWASLFSPVCSVFVTDVQGRLEADQADMSTAHLEAILKTLQNTGSPRRGVVSPTWTEPALLDVPRQSVSVLLYEPLRFSARCIPCRARA